MRVWSETSEEIGGLAWSADGRWLAQACRGPVIRVREVDNGSIVQIWNESASRRQPCHAALVFGPQGSVFAHIDRQVLRFTAGLRERLFGYTGRARTDAVDRLQLSADGQVLLTGDGQGLELRTHARLPKPRPPAWVVDDIRLSAVALSPDGQTCALAWDVDDQRHHTLALALVESRTGEHRAWLTQGELPACDELWFSPDGARLVVIGLRPSQRIREVSVFALRRDTWSLRGAGGRAPLTLTLPADGADVDRRRPGARAGCVALMPDGERLVNAAGRVLEVVELGAPARVAGALFARVELPIDELTCLSVSPDGRAAAVGNRRGEVAVVALTPSAG